jgi:hypothetical protein
VDCAVSSGLNGIRTRARSAVGSRQISMIIDAPKSSAPISQTTGHLNKKHWYKLIHPVRKWPQICNIQFAAKLSHFSRGILTRLSGKCAGQVQLIVDRLSGRGFRQLNCLLKGQLAGAFGGAHLLPFLTPIDGADAKFSPIRQTRASKKD